MTPPPSRLALLSAWQPRQVDSLLRAAMRHTHFVVASKGVLGGLAAVLIFAVIWFPLHENRDAFRLVSASVHPGDADSDARMQKPHFSGLDDTNRPYTISADTATPQPDKRVLLDHLDADLTLQDNAWISATAAKGVLDVTGKLLTLSGGIELFHDAGYTLATESAAIDLGKGTATSEYPVNLHGPAGRLTARGFVIENRGEILRFQGPVSVTLYPRGQG